MRLLLRSETGEFSLTKDLVADDPIPPYAILSHRWLADAEEPTFEDLTNRTGEEKHGYEKIRFCGEQARQDGLQYLWVDTCCIDKANYAEVSRAINSMFYWYRNATRCYVYLSDVPRHLIETNNELNPRPWESDFRKSEWFNRGWTLQELLAPISLEFFSRKRNRLGDKGSLAQLIYEITGIPKSALQGARLSQFSDNERFSWIERRKTSVDEDRAYSLLGIFDVHIPLRYGEGMASAFKRLEEAIDKLNKCVQDLRLTDPRDDKKRIEDTKGGLLKDSYRWILENSDYQQWYRAQQSRLLWIKGGPGKGKTMLLCGIINELGKPKAQRDLLSYFFCQTTDSRINNATAVLRGLIYMLVDQQPSLVSHIRKKYDRAGKALFEDANAWVALSEIFTNILEDPSLNTTYLIIDALDECVTDLPKLVDFLVRKSARFPRVQWIVSSRKWPSIEKHLHTAMQNVTLCLELNEKSVSAAVATYVQFKVNWLAERNGYGKDIRDAVQRSLSLNANGTFLWVALVCQELADISEWDAKEISEAFPPGLDLLYKRMLDQICSSKHAKLCKSILAVVSAVRRPITLEELASFIDMPARSSGNYKVLVEIIGLCGSFLILRERIIFFIHQSAKDFLVEKAYNEIYPSGIEYVHHNIFSRSLQIMSKKLGRDVYDLGAPGFLIDQVKKPDSDPLSPARYSCVYWINHLIDCDVIRNATNDLQDGGSVDKFLRQSYLYWLEALSLYRSLSEGIVSIAKLEALLQARAEASALLELVRDARRFIMYHKLAIENSPLQAYMSALMFSPAHSLIKGLFKHEEPKWITIKPPTRKEWSACLQTLEGHSYGVNSVAFTRDSTRLASASSDGTVKIWDTSSGECLQTLEGYRNGVNSVAFTRDSTRLASASSDGTVKIWDTSSGECLQTLEGHSEDVNSVAFTRDSTRLASASSDGTVKIWDTSSGECLQTLEGHSEDVNSVAFTRDSTRLASASSDGTVKIWDTSSGECLQTLEGHSREVNSVAFTRDSTRLASASWDGTVKIWDTSSGECLQTLEGYRNGVNSVAFTRDSTRLASASSDGTVKIWDTSSGECLQTLEGHSREVNSVAFTRDSTRLASASSDGTVKIWDTSSGECLQTLEGHSREVNSVAFTRDSTRLASTSSDGTVKIWDTSSGECLQTLEGHSEDVNSVAFTRDSTRLASASWDGTVKIWDTSSGECLQTLEGHSREVNSVAFTRDSTRLASASWDGTVKIWDTSSGECLQTLEGYRNGVNSVAFTRDSTRLASASSDGTVKIWDTSSGECLQTLEGYRNGVNSVAFTRDSTRLASASSDGTVKIWDTSSGECLQTLEGHSEDVNSVAFTRDSTRLASASSDGTVKIWDTSSGECLQTLEGHSEDVNSVAFTRDSTRLASASSDGTVKIWDTSSGECLQTLEGHSREVNSVAFTRDSTRLASASWDGTVKIWDTSSGECLQTLEGYRNGVNSVAFTRDSTRLASASWDGTVKIWDTSSGECLQTLEGHSEDVNSVAFTRDSTRLASASSDGTVKIWDTSSGECLQTLEGYRNGVNSVAFTRDSTRLASASSDGTVKIWDTSSGECLQTLEGHSEDVNSVAFTRDSTRLASASSDGTVKIWDTSSGECLQTLEGHSYGVNSVAFTRDSTRLASASWDGTVKIWDTSSGECLQTLVMMKALRNISFDATGSRLYTEIGTITISVSSALDTTPNIVKPQDLRYQGLSLSSDNVWIKFNSENVVWLPSEYRPLCSAVSTETVGIGVGSGKVWMCSFNGRLV